MNKNKLITLLIIINLLLIGFCLYNNSNIVLSGEKQIIKEMTDGEYESQITELNKSHEDYANNVENSKKLIATALNNEGVETAEDATLETMATNISKVVQVKTSSATATSEDIAFGKTAYVNGELITGTGANFEKKIISGDFSPVYISVDFNIADYDMICAENELYNTVYMDIDTMINFQQAGVFYNKGTFTNGAGSFMINRPDHINEIWINIPLTNTTFTFYKLK